MASEKRGLLYEAIVFECLTRLKSQGAIKEEVFWNQTPEQMSIDTDLTVGPKPHEPTHVFLISHSTAEHNSDMKFWRNMGELREVKFKLGFNVKAIGLLFDAQFKKNLLLVQPYAFDNFICVADKDYGQAILNFADKHSEALPGKKEEKHSFLKKHINEDKKLRRAIEDLTNELKVAFTATCKSTDALWLAVKESYSGRKPKPPLEARSTFLRRGLAKMLFFEKLPQKYEITLNLSADLNLTRRSIKGTLLSDTDIHATLDLLPRSLLQQLHASYLSMEEFQILVEPLRALDQFPLLWQHIKDRWQLLKTPQGLYQELQIAAKDGMQAFQGARNKSKFKFPGWLLVILITIIKAGKNRRLEYGYSKIVNDIQALIPSELQQWKEIVKGTEKHSPEDPRGSRTIEYGLRDWIYADSRSNFTFHDSELALVSLVLSRRLSAAFGGEFPESIADSVKEFFIADTIETKLLSHPSFRPLKELIIAGLKEKNLTYQDISYFQSPLRGMAVSKGERVNIRAASTNVIVTKRTLIRWISVSDEGRMHKCKEFCGRAWGFRVQTDFATGKVSSREEVKKFVLLVDGTFDNADLRALVDAGWDEIFYPDQIELLLRSII